MPVYEFKDKLTEEVHEQFMSISAMEKYLEENPNKEIHHSSAFTIVTGVNMKPAQGFRDILNVIKKRSGVTNTVNDW